MAGPGGQRGGRGRRPGQPRAGAGAAVVEQLQPHARRRLRPPRLRPAGGTPICKRTRGQKRSF
jgi:hypothetical protein